MSASSPCKSAASSSPKNQRSRASKAWMPAATTVDQAVGERVRTLRKSKGLSLETVAATTGLSIGFLSQIERGLSSPTLRALTSLADATGVGIADLLQPGQHEACKAPRITRVGRRVGVAMWKAGISKAVLAGGATVARARFAFTALTFEVGASSGDEYYSHAGEEAGYVVEGRLLLQFQQGASWVLEPGDSFHFGSDQLHRFENAAPLRTVVVMLNLSSAASAS